MQCINKQALPLTILGLFLVFSDCQLLRCTLKILDVVFPNMSPKTPASPSKPKKPQFVRRRRTTSSSKKRSPTHSSFHTDQSRDAKWHLETEASQSASSSRNGVQAEKNKSQELTDTEEENEQSAFDLEMLKTLYEIIQGLLNDVLKVIEKVGIIHSYCDDMALHTSYMDLLAGHGKNIIPFL